MIVQKLRNYFIGSIAQKMELLRCQLDDAMILQGRALALQNELRSPLQSLHDAEFKVFSQFGEDGILQYLIHETKISVSERTFIEFGVQDYQESNTRFLLVNNYWKGLVIDGNSQSVGFIRGQNYYWRGNLTAISAWIDRDNINKLISDSGFVGDIGVLSVDIDGNDYWVWKNIEVVRPVIVVVEWNSVFGADHAISVPYDPAFLRKNAHYSCLYWGASIKAFVHLAELKGYALLGSNMAGINLFFVRKDRLGRLSPISVDDAYVDSVFRDSRNESGKLNFLSGQARHNEILDLPIVQVETDQITTLRQLERL